MSIVVYLIDSHEQVLSTQVKGGRYSKQCKLFTFILMAVNLVGCFYYDLVSLIPGDLYFFIGPL